MLVVDRRSFVVVFVLRFLTRSRQRGGGITATAAKTSVKERISSRGSHHVHTGSLDDRLRGGAASLKKVSSFIITKNNFILN